jgi:ABC-2 type transport system ATP-binding protein
VKSVKKLQRNSWLIEAEGEEDIRPFLFNFAVSNSLTVLSLQQQENNLEEVFRQLTNP